jgi:hypothetical protein
MSGSANDFAQHSDVWRPRYRVLIGKGGVRAPGDVADIDVTAITLSVMTQKQNWYQADRHKIVLSLWEQRQFGYFFWADFISMSVLVEIGFEKNLTTEMTEVFRGFVDKIAIDAVRGTVTLTGRNTFLLLTDGKEISFDTNATIKEIIERVAKETKIEVDTSQVKKVDLGTMKGRFWPTNEEKVDGRDGHNATMNPNDIYSQISREYGVFYYEDGGTVFFKDNDLEGTVGFVAVAPQGIYEEPSVTKLTASNCTSLEIEHNLNISQWDWYVNATNYDHAGEADGNRALYPEGNKDSPFGRAHYAQSANRHHDDNVKLAKSQFEEFTLHEWSLTAKCSGPQILGLKLNNLLNIEGTGTIIDGDYVIDSIEHQLDFQRGYVGTVKGRWGAGIAGQTGAGLSGPSGIGADVPGGAPT